MLFGLRLLVRAATAVIIAALKIAVATPRLAVSE
jgi:hypothetical protein